MKLSIFDQVLRQCPLTNKNTWMSTSTQFWVLNTCRHVAATDSLDRSRGILAIHMHRDREYNMHTHPYTHSLVCGAPRSHWCSGWEAKPDAGEIQSGRLLQWPWPRYAASQWLRGTVLPIWSWAPCRIFTKTQGGQKNFEIDLYTSNTYLQPKNQKLKSISILYWSFCMCAHTHTH